MDLIFRLVKYLILGRYFIHKVNHDKNKSGKHNLKANTCKFVEKSVNRSCKIAIFAITYLSSSILMLGIFGIYMFLEWAQNKNLNNISSRCLMVNKPQQTSSRRTYHSIRKVLIRTGTCRRHYMGLTFRRSHVVFHNMATSNSNRNMDTHNTSRQQIRQTPKNLWGNTRGTATITQLCVQSRRHEYVFLSLRLTYWWLSWAFLERTIFTLSAHDGDFSTFSLLACSALDGSLTYLDFRSWLPDLITKLLTQIQALPRKSVWMMFMCCGFQVVL